MPWNISQGPRLRRLFLEGFTAMDVAEPLVSFDEQTDAVETRQFMDEKDFDLVGIRNNGLINGYVRREDLVSGTCGDHCQPFTPDDDLVADTANLIDVVKSLAINEQCFVTILDRVGAIITLQDLEKPPMRMFLFGLITIVEMLVTQLLQQRYPDGSWQEMVSAPRLEKAQDLQTERARRGQQVDLLQCLQYSDKVGIITYDPDIRRALGHDSRKAARKAIKELEMLRNNLAHSQLIIPTGWQRIVTFCNNLERILEKAINPFVPSAVFGAPDQSESSEPYLVIDMELRERKDGWWDRLCETIPELKPLADTPQPKTYHAEGDVAVHTRLAVEACPQECELDLLWVALLHDIGKAKTTKQTGDKITAHGHAQVGAKMADEILIRLGMPSIRRLKIVWTINQHVFHHSWSLTKIEDASRKHRIFVTDPKFPFLLEFIKADTIASHGHPEGMQVYEFYKALMEHFSKEGKSKGDEA
jgi:putative nucleotidyltransferase with HDIG domain